MTKPKDLSQKIHRRNSFEDQIQDLEWRMGLSLKHKISDLTRRDLFIIMYWNLYSSLIDQVKKEIFK